MKMVEKFMESLVQPKNSVFEAKEGYRSKVEQDRTAFNLNSMQRVYKLSQAYASVRNLDFRADTEITHQTFRDYLLAREHLVRVKFAITDKPRPSYPPDEGYLNTRKWFLYNRGRLLVLVDADIYDKVAKAIDQYVLDVGREGYWATIHAVHAGKPADKFFHGFGHQRIDPPIR